MTVWIIPAADSKAAKNYPKTLSNPIANERLNKVRMFTHLPNIDLYAWGFPDNDKNLSNIKKMEIGDICFFYCQSGTKEKSKYRWVARVAEVPPLNSANEISEAFWDEKGFIPYLLDKPIDISISTEEFGLSLNPITSYMRSHPLGSMSLSDEEKAKPAIDEHGSFDAWALDLIEKQTFSTNSKIDIQRYFVDPVDGNLSNGIEITTGLFNPKLKQINPEKKTTNANGFVRRSKESKKIGDLGENIVFQYLQETLSSDLLSSLEWVATKGLKPGWDIQYMDSSNNIIAVEVKATTASKFQTVEITANELESAKKKGKDFHLYLLSNCMNPTKRKIEIIVDPAEKYKDLLTPTMYRIG